MMQTVIGLILLLAPLLLLTKFKDKKLGFVYILSFIILFHMLLAVLTQFLGIFSYFTILAVNLVGFFAVIYYSDFKSIKLDMGKIDWMLITVLVISFISLFSVHFHYFGEYNIATSPNYIQANGLSYTYPYFSDEWYSVSFIQYSFDSGKLPFINPLVRGDSFYPNLTFTSFSLTSEIMMLLGLNPLADYVFIIIFANILIILLIYLFLRFCKLGVFASGLASLSALYITSSATLPTIWNLIPMTYALIVLLISLFFLLLKNNKMLLFLAALMFMMYPPILIFYFIGYVFRFYSNKSSLKHFIYLFIIAFSLMAVIHLALYILVYVSSTPWVTFWKNTFLIYFDRIFFESYSGQYMVSYPILKIFPLVTLIFSVFGVFSKIKRNFWLFSMPLLGLIYWILYSFVNFRFVISYPRAVYITCIFLVIFAGFGLDFVIKNLKGLKMFYKNRFLDILFLIILVLLLVSPLQGFYTSRDNWKSFNAVLKTDFGEIKFPPAASANTYLTDDDLLLFKEIHNENFLSLPWKGTVIGVATGNYPLCIKPGILSFNNNLYDEFLNEDCDGKISILEKGNAVYVYSTPILCNNFEMLGESNEGLVLYRYNPR